jgi:methanogenic corrinoid protein MtbC1/DNA-binding XRE family transcriptional regulator
MLYITGQTRRHRVVMSGERPQAMGSLARRFLEAAVMGDARSASVVVADAMRGEPELAGVYQEVFAPALERVGRLWASGRLMVAQEHLATQVTLDLMARVRQQARRPARKTGLAAVVAAIEGEQHWVGARMVADLLEEAGWSVDFLGPNTPVEDLVAHVAGRRPVQLVVVSVTMDACVPALGRLSRGLRALPSPPKIVVGGLAAQRQPALAVELGADAVATDAADTVATARRLVPTTSSPNPPLERVLLAVGRNVQELRGGRGWSQQVLAAEAGLDRTYISAVERGRQNLTVGALLSLARALGVPIADLLATEEDRA